jgi:hypothetical protein
MEQLVTGGGCSISFQSYFSPPPKLQESEAVFLFIQDLRVLDDAFEIAWFWTKDPKGLSRLSQADMFLLGLDEPHHSKVYVHGFQPKPTIWKELGVFHELFGFPAYSDSPDIPHFLNLPFASVQWDGAHPSCLSVFFLYNIYTNLRGREWSSNASGPFTQNTMHMLLL